MAGKLRKQTITVPLGAETDQSIDPKMLPAGTLADARNILHSKHGLVNKAPGWAEKVYTLPRAAAKIGPPSTLIEHRDQMLAGGDIRGATFDRYDGEGFHLCSYLPLTDEMKPAGAWPPISQKQSKFAYGEALVDPDVCALGGYVWAAWAVAGKVYLTVQEELTGSVILQPTEVAAPGADCVSLQWVKLDTVCHLYFITDSGAGADAIYQLICEVANPTTPTLSVGTIPALLGTSICCCRADVLAYGTLAAVGYIEVGGTLWVKCFEEDGTAGIQTAISAGNPANDVFGICQVRDYGSSINRLALMFPQAAQIEVSIHNWDIGLTQDTNGILAPEHVAGVTIAITGAQSDTGYDESGAGWEALHVFWEEEITGTYSTYRKVRHKRAKIPAFATYAEGVPWMYHGLLTKAFDYKHRAHCWLYHDSDTSPQSALVAGGKRPDGSTLIAGVQELIPEALFQIGRTNHRLNPSRPQVSEIGTRFVWAAHSTEYGDEKTASISWVDYFAKNMDGASFDDDLILPGGLLRCYDGRSLADHCMPYAPEVVVTSEAHGAGPPIPGALWEDESYYYVICYEWIDANGLLHISEPSAVEQVDIGIDLYLNGQTKTINGLNHSLDIQETTIPGVIQQITVTHGTYATFHDLAQAITNDISNQAVGVADHICCQYNAQVNFPFINDLGPAPISPTKLDFQIYYPFVSVLSWSILWNTGPNAGTTIGTAIGFDVSADDVFLAGYPQPYQWRLIGDLSCETEQSRQQGAVTLRLRPLASGDYDRNYYATRLGIYRTPKGGGEYHLVEHINNDISAEVLTYVDIMSDEDLIENPLVYSTGQADSILPNGPIVSSAVVSTNDRLWGIDAEDPTHLPFTKKKAPGVAAEWSPNLYLTVKEHAKAIGSIGSIVIAFTDSSIFSFSGDGPNDLGIGEFYPARLLTSTVGCDIQASVCNAGGGLVFAGTDGRIYQIDKSLAVKRIDEPIENELASAGIRQIALDIENQVIRVVLDSNTHLIYDYAHDRWSPWDVMTGILNVCPYAGGVYHLDEYGTSPGALLVETPAAWKRNALPYPIDITTAWIRLSSLLGFMRAWWLYVLGTWKSAHKLTLEVFVDYKTTAVSTVEIDLLADPGGYLLRRKLARQKCTAIKVRIYDSAQTGTCESCELTGLEFIIGSKGPLLRRAKKTG